MHLLWSVGGTSLEIFELVLEAFAQVDEACDGCQGLAWNDGLRGYGECGSKCGVSTIELGGAEEGWVREGNRVPSSLVKSSLFILQDFHSLLSSSSCVRPMERSALRTLNPTRRGTHSLRPVCASLRMPEEGTHGQSILERGTNVDEQADSVEDLGCVAVCPERDGSMLPAHSLPR